MKCGTAMLCLIFCRKKGEKLHLTIFHTVRMTFCADRTGSAQPQKDPQQRHKVSKSKHRQAYDPYRIPYGPYDANSENPAGIRIEQNLRRPKRKPLQTQSGVLMGIFHSRKGIKEGMNHTFIPYSIILEWRASF